MVISRAAACHICSPSGGSGGRGGWGGGCIVTFCFSHVANKKKREGPRPPTYVTSTKEEKKKCKIVVFQESDSH